MLFSDKTLVRSQQPKRSHPRHTALLSHHQGEFHVERLANGKHFWLVNDDNRRLSCDIFRQALLYSSTLLNHAITQVRWLPRRPNAPQKYWSTFYAYVPCTFQSFAMYSFASLVESEDSTPASTSFTLINSRLSKRQYF